MAMTVLLARGAGSFIAVWRENVRWCSGRDGPPLRAPSGKITIKLGTDVPKTPPPPYFLLLLLSLHAPPLARFPQQNLANLFENCFQPNLVNSSRQLV